jgi:hypothetical protein
MVSRQPSTVTAERRLTDVRVFAKLRFAFIPQKIYIHQIDFHNRW